MKTINTYKYYEIYRVVKPENKYILRQKLINYAICHGIKAAMRAFSCSRNTVRKWLRRYKESNKDISSLADRSRRPHNSPNKTARHIELKVIELKKRTGFGAERLKEEFDISCSVGAIKRIFRQNGLVRERRRKHERKRLLANIKRQWALFGQISYDTKHLYDIPFYWAQMKRLGLPSHQYTAREVVSGLSFVGYADELSKTYSCILADQVCKHLQAHGLEMKGIDWQIDNGSEFREKVNDLGVPSVVSAFGCSYHYIPPKAYRWQSDVETVHRLEEDEFFDRETFLSREEFFKKVTIYWLYFNIARRNRNKEHKTPLQIIKERMPHLPESIALFPPLDLSAFLCKHYTIHRRGHDLPVHPYT
ncbi:MAG: helix-turn-helix domain-containing protein [candidate division WOR-3 bacterium]